MEINITSGEELDEYLRGKSGGIFIPFNEATIDGKLLYPLFDEAYIAERAKVHNVSEEEYREKLGAFIDFETIKSQVSKMTLWFGPDAFCEINLLSLLTYLEQVGYSGSIALNLIEDFSKKILEKGIEIKLGGFKDVYFSLMGRKKPETSLPFLNQGLADYLEITSPDNEVVRFIKESQGRLTEKEIVKAVFVTTRRYGLGDVQIRSLIEIASGKVD